MTLFICSERSSCEDVVETKTEREKKKEKKKTSDDDIFKEEKYLQNLERICTR